MAVMLLEHLLVVTNIGVLVAANLERERNPYIDRSLRLSRLMVFRPWSFAYGSSAVTVQSAFLE
jgi:hypothetical protein